MVAGLPGTGIGGFFFLVSALLMPVIELVHTVQGKSSWKRWRFISVHTGLALGILGAIWITGWVLGRVLFALAQLNASPITVSMLEPQNFIQEAPIVITLVTLLSVLLSVKVLQKTLGTR